MTEKRIEIWVGFSSEKTNAGVGLGTSYNPDEQPNGPDPEWILDGTLGEAFWELYEEFEPGVEKARQLVQSSPDLTLKQALFEVFGHFVIWYEVDGVEKDLGYDLEADKLIYPLLEEMI